MKKIKRAVFTAIILLVAALVNIIAGKIPFKTLDVSENRLFSIDDSTAEYLKKLNAPVKIYFMRTEKDLDGGGIGFKQTNEIAKRFAETGNVKLVYVDLANKPNFTSAFRADVTSESIVVQSEKTGRYKVVEPDKYLYTRYYLGDGTEIPLEYASYCAENGIAVYSDVYADAEQVLLSAVMYAANDKTIRVAFTVGFGEGRDTSYSATLYEGLYKLLEDNAYSPETVDLNLKEIDKDVDFTVIFAPVYDYSESAIKKLEQWLELPGKKTLIYVASVANTETTKLDEFLQKRGIKTEKSFIYQTDSSYRSPQNSLFQIMKIPDSSAYAENTGKGYFAGDTMRNITITQPDENTEVYPLLTSYGGAAAAPIEQITESGVEPDISTLPKSELNAGVESVKYSQAGISRVIAFSSPFIFDKYYIESAQFSNAAFFLNIFNVISERENTPAITPKMFGAKMFEISAKTANTAALVYVIILPAIAAVIGTAVNIKRKRQ